jgi:hypothetical protein
MHDSNDSQNETKISLISLSDYILKSREERIAHIDLSTDCELGTFRSRSRGGLDGLFSLIGVEDDIENWTVARIHCCHLCDCGRRKGECGNPRHIYIGTASENSLDLPKDFRVQRARGDSGAGHVISRNAEKYKQFVTEYSTDVSMHSWSLRKLGRRYGVSNQAIKKWIYFLNV